MPAPPECGSAAPAPVSIPTSQNSSPAGPFLMRHPDGASRRRPDGAGGRRRQRGVGRGAAPVALGIFLGTLACLPLGDGFLVGPWGTARHHTVGVDRRPKLLGFHAVPRPLHRTTFRSVQVDEPALELEWLPLMEDLQRTLYMSADAGANQTEAPSGPRGREEPECHEDDGADDQGDRNDDMAKRAARLALLQRRNARTAPKHAPKATSVGPRRENPAHRGAATTILLDTVRNKARGKSATSANSDSTQDDGEAKTTSRLTASAIHETVAEMIRKRSRTTLSLFTRTMGILGEPTVEASPANPIHLADTTSDVTVRVASPQDDTDIAGLRLSVFSEYATDIQNQFRARSCQAIHQRRLRGAVCVVATVPSRDPARHDVVVGSAECSFDEFSGTRLGRRRPVGSALYVTEVAVHPSMRRRGIGYKLLQAIDRIAESRGAESLFLHVDVKNKFAIDLYRKAGYEPTGEDQMFLEFTRSLNLHPGATKGRDHYLLCKHIREPTLLPDVAGPPSKDAVILSRIGFEIPA